MSGRSRGSGSMSARRSCELRLRNLCATIMGVYVRWTPCSRTSRRKASSEFHTLIAFQRQLGRADARTRQQSEARTSLSWETDMPRDHESTDMHQSEAQSCLPWEHRHASAVLCLATTPTLAQRALLRPSRCNHLSAGEEVD